VTLRAVAIRGSSLTSAISRSISRLQAGQDLPALARLFLSPFPPRRRHDVEAITTVALAEDDFARLEMLAAEARRLFVLSWDDVRWQHQIEEPVGGDPELRSKPGTSLDRSRAREPGDKAGEFESEDVGDGGPMSEPGKFSARLECERPLRLSAQCGDEVPRQARRLPGWRAGPSAQMAVRSCHPRSTRIADRPHTRVVEHLQNS